MPEFEVSKALAYRGMVEMDYRELPADQLVVHPSVSEFGDLYSVPCRKPLAKCASPRNADSRNGTSHKKAPGFLKPGALLPSSPLKPT